MNASGTNVDWEPSNDPVTAHLFVFSSYAKASPNPWVPCWTTIPPSPGEFDPEANKINLSATSKLVVLWNEAVPNTVKFLDTIKSWPIVTSLGKPIVKVVPPAEVSISLFVPTIDKAWEAKSTVPTPVEPENAKSAFAFSAYEAVKA